ncbi:MAG: ATP synthase F1 subunit epsilon [Janthinobacterium lividum]
MAELLRFELVSPEKSLRSSDVFMVVVPGSEGDFGVMLGHAPLVSTIRPGAIHIYPTSMSDVPERIFVAGGFAEVGTTGLTILAESATVASEIDVEGVARELVEARELLRAAHGEAEINIAERIAKLEAMQAVVVN